MNILAKIPLSNSIPPEVNSQLIMTILTGLELTEARAKPQCLAETIAMSLLVTPELYLDK